MDILLCIHGEAVKIYGKDGTVLVIVTRIICDIYALGP